MGSRIHKAIGYGISALKCKENNSTDPRIDWVKFYSRKNMDMKAFALWMQDHKNEIMALYSREYQDMYPLHDDFDFRLEIQTLNALEEGKAPRLNECIIQGSEGRVLMFVPPEYHHEWFRYDNAIDYVESDGRTQAKKLRTGGFPEPNQRSVMREPAGSFVETGDWVYPSENCDELGPTLLDAGRYAQLTGTWDHKLPAIAKGKFLQHLKQDFRPRVPLPVLALVLSLECVHDPAAFIDDLRPMVYTYWC